MLIINSWLLYWSFSAIKAWLFLYQTSFSLNTVFVAFPVLWNIPVLDNVWKRREKSLKHKPQY